MEVVITKDILKANDTLAASIQRQLDAAGVYMINVLGSPGAGKTTLIEALDKALRGDLRAAVIEGDLATSKDAERLEQLGIPSVQINTGGGCHLESNMVAEALNGLKLDDTDIVLIENVGNLVCTASHKLGERLRITLLSTTEGDDKVAKYPPIFQRTDAIVVTKADLLPYVDFDMDKMVADAKKLNPDVKIFTLAARGDTPEGVEDLAAWIREHTMAFRDAQKA